MAQLYELRLQATGEVRDAAGNLVEQIPVEQTVTLTEEQVRGLVAEQEES